MNIQSIDLRPITRRSDVLGAVFRIQDEEYNWVPWIKCGEIKLQKDNRYGDEFRVCAHLRDGATDFEHDSAYAFAFDAIGVTYEMTEGHNTFLSGWFKPDPDSFCVPDEGYDPFSIEGAVKCQNCESGHVIVPEGCYMPPRNDAMFKALSSKRFELNISVRRPRED